MHHHKTIPLCLAAALMATDATSQDPRTRMFGSPVPGIQGDPVLLSDALPELGGVPNLRIHNGTPGASSVLLLGLTPTSLPVFGLEILVDPILVDIPLPPLDPLGSGQLELPLPPDPGLQSLTLAWQSFIVDPAAPGPLPLSQTNGLLWELNLPGALPPPQVFTVSPTSGTEGTVITIFGQGFDPDPDNNCVFLGDFHARARVLTATPNQITAIIGPVNDFTTSGEVRVARGSALRVPGNFFDSGLNQSIADPRMLLVAGERAIDLGFSLGFGLGNTARATSVGANTISFSPLGSWSGNFQIDIYVRDASGNLTKDIHIPVSAVAMSFQECVAHIRAHLKAVLPDVTVTGSAATGTIAVSDASFGPATTGSITG